MIKVMCGNVEMFVEVIEGGRRVGVRRKDFLQLSEQMLGVRGLAVLEAVKEGEKSGWTRETKTLALSNLLVLLIASHGDRSGSQEDEWVWVNLQIAETVGKH